MWNDVMFKIFWNSSWQTWKLHILDTKGNNYVLIYTHSSNCKQQLKLSGGACGESNKNSENQEASSDKDMVNIEQTSIQSPPFSPGKPGKFPAKVGHQGRGSWLTIAK